MSGRLQSIAEVSQKQISPPASPEVRSQSVLVRMFSRRWLLATVLVIIGVAVNIRLGIWQLDRLEQRRAFNTQVLSQINQPVLQLNDTVLQDRSMIENLAKMEYRSVTVSGVYDYEHEVALRNQAVGNQIGVHLLTPLRISSSDQVVLVNRGWVPIDDFDYGGWEEYEQPGLVEVQGMIRASQSKPDYGRRSDSIPGPGEDPLRVWYFANVEGIALQVPYSLLPVYIQQAPDPTWTGLPQPTLPDLEITEGPHLSYAMQWFSFAAILGIGYPFFIRRQERKRSPGLT